MIRPFLVLLYAATAMVSSAQTFTTLVVFDETNGDDPNFGSLLQATDGNLYGTTIGGTFGSFGTVFKLSPAGVLTTFYSFPLATQGATPWAGLVQATNGDLYGTTQSGGAYNFGTIFKITLSGTLTTLYNFCAETNCPDGSHPQTGLVQTLNGDLYGTTSNGGTNNNGTIFKITPAGTLTTLYKFNSSDGIGPNALVQGGQWGTLRDGRGRRRSWSWHHLQNYAVRRVNHSPQFQQE